MSAFPFMLAPGAGYPAPAEDDRAEPYAEYSAEERARIQRCPRHRIVSDLCYSPNTFGDYHWSVPACCADCPLQMPRGTEPEPYSNYSPEERILIMVCPTHCYGATPGGGWLAAQPSCAVSGPWGSCGCPASREPAAAGADTKAEEIKARIKGVNASLKALLEDYNNNPSLDEVRWIGIQIGQLHDELEKLEAELEKLK